MMLLRALLAIIVVIGTNAQYLKTRSQARNDGTAELVVEVDHMNNGYADKASWTLPNGVTLQPGQSSDGYTATHQMYLGGRTSQYKLHVSKSATSFGSLQFKVASSGQYGRPGWEATASFTLHKPATRPTLSGEIKVTHRSTGSWPSIQYVQEAEFKITVKGGDPKPDKYEWTLPWGNKIVPGQRSGDYYAKHQTTNMDGSQTFILQITNNAQYSHIHFTASNGAAYSVSAHS